MREHTGPSERMGTMMFGMLLAWASGFAMGWIALYVVVVVLGVPLAR